jgi:hypothetical protein
MKVFFPPLKRGAKKLVALRRRGSRRALGIAAATAILAVLGAGSLAASGAESLGKLEKELRQAISRRQTSRALELASALAETGAPKAYKILIQRCLNGDSYTLEKRVGQLLVECKDPETRALVAAELGSRQMPTYKRRIILLAVAARMAEDPQMLAAIHGTLRDPSRAVVLTALGWMCKLRKKDFVEPLIKALQIREQRPRDRVYFDILKALREITNADMEQAADWKNYAKGQKSSPNAKPKKQSLTVLHRPSFFEVALDTDRMLFLIDVSDSMKRRDEFIEEGPRQGGRRGPTAGSKTKVAKDDKENEKEQKKKEGQRTGALGPERARLARVKAELVRVIKQLGSRTRFGVVSFSHEIKWMGDTKALKLASADNKAEAMAWVRSLAPSGATRTDLALQEAFRADVDTIYLLTDGAPKDTNDTRLPIGKILRQTKQANRFLRRRIHTVSFLGVKDSSMRTFVKTLAEQNDGECKLLP